MSNLQPGMTATATVIVSDANTAATIKSGCLAVFATPAMCALMEEAACAAVAPGMEEGTASVGTMLNITHDRASKLGDTIVAKATLTAVEGRKLCFDIEAEDSKGLIGKGKHERFIINIDKFMSKVNS